MDFSHLTGFHRKTFKERFNTIQALYPELNGVLKGGGLNLDTANLMIENWVGMVSLPLGLGLYFNINGRSYNVPMCIEEPSIVAAACNGAKMVASNGGFIAKSNDPIMMGQIQIYDVNLETT